MPPRLRSLPEQRVARLPGFEPSLLLILGFVAGFPSACGESSKEPAGSVGGAGEGGVGGGGTGGNATAGSHSAGSGESGSASVGPLTVGAGIGAARFNQCGVAAPLPENTGQCTTVSAPTITDFDDFAGDDAANYTYYVNAPPPAPDAVLGAILHVGDGSDEDAETSVITTGMVAGADDAGYALEFGNTEALNWGGLLMFYFPGSSTASVCLDAQSYGGIEFSVKGSTPSGRFGVNLGMLDTIPTSDSGLCANPTASDCKDATVSFHLAEDSETWTQVRIPWSSFTPGVGSDLSCVPVTGQNIVRLVIQPFMNYPPPDYSFESGPYSMVVDDVRFYGATDVDNASAAGGAAGAGDTVCTLSASLEWNGSAPMITPRSDASHNLVAVKDPTVVHFGERWHVYASSVSSTGAYNMVYTSFTDWSEASSAPLYYMDQTAGFDTYVAAPQLFYFTPQDKWYLVFQAGPPKYSTSDDPGDPTAWTPPEPFFSATPAIITENGGGWLDFWVICDTASCHLFFSNNDGRWYNSKTSIDEFPNGFGEPVLVMQDTNSGRIFEASNVYKMNGTSQYLALIEAFDQTSSGRRYYRSWIADSLDGPWQPWQASGSYPFAGARNVTFDGSPWTNDISHGEMIRSGYDETLAVDPCNLRYLFQGADPDAETGGDYNKIPWQIGLLTQTE